MARPVVKASSHFDLFTAAALKDSESDQRDLDKFRCLLLAVLCSAKHKMALGVDLSAILMHQRRNATLDASNLQFNHNEGLLRAAPLDSSQSFRGEINEASAVNMTDLHNSVLKCLARFTNTLGTKKIKPEPYS